MVEHCGAWRRSNQIPATGVEVKPSNVGKRESKKFYEREIRTDGVMERSGPIWSKQPNGPRVDAILHEGR